MTTTNMASPIPRQRWTSAQDIIAKIDEIKERIAKLRKAAENLDKRADRFFQRGLPNGLNIGVAKAWRIRAERKRDKAINIEGGYLSRLKGRLAIFQTDMLPFDNNTDKSIPQ